MLEHAGPRGLLDHSQDLRRFHVEHLRDAALSSVRENTDVLGAVSVTHRSLREHTASYLVEVEKLGLGYNRDNRECVL